MFNNQDSILPLIDTRGKGGYSSRAKSIRHLPPGCRFYPSEKVLFDFYLTGKNNSVAADPADICGCDLISELNLYDYEPFELPDGTCFVHGYRGRKRHWFCYTKSNGRRKKRRVKGGFWRRIGKDEDVVDGGNVVLGTKAKFVYYAVNSVKAKVRTPWIMLEYSLLHHLKASFVLCRVFVKPRTRNNVSENLISCSAEESVSAFCHVGVRPNGFLRPCNHEAGINGDEFTKEVASSIATRPAFLASLELPSGIPPDRPNDMVGSRLTTNELQSIVEEDFIELEDLVDGFL
ncbi:RING/U-box superfamily protein, putative isoform 1 [Hibiscus syriacus]|uniref:RING/U-box superfamily protein, putative isoform 1 n=1 Tax=Hibiscus syriacus TaxID=106335 RepID=A0A6A3D011_HIBSY|nr:NAC domain-containing protein 96-like [Hibiscus syriacus]KAE8734890.1 RING/U-box superfamily protein, putative isoform 1 [Hibiscus syriacus]